MNKVPAYGKYVYGCHMDCRPRASYGESTVGYIADYDLKSRAVFSALCISMTILTRDFRKIFTKEKVTNKLVSLKERFHNFKQYVSLPSVLYCPVPTHSVWMQLTGTMFVRYGAINFFSSYRNKTSLQLHSYPFLYTCKCNIYFLVCCNLYGIGVTSTEVLLSGGGAYLESAP